METAGSLLLGEEAGAWRVEDLLQAVCHGKHRGRHEGTHYCNIIETPWLVNGGHGASLRHHRSHEGIIEATGGNLSKTNHQKRSQV
jgi:hypothetical protein